VQMLMPKENNKKENNKKKPVSSCEEAAADAVNASSVEPTAAADATDDCTSRR